MKVGGNFENILSKTAKFKLEYISDDWHKREFVVSQIKVSITTNFLVLTYSVIDSIWLPIKRHFYC
jgi:hypothetical protein